jgi:hypothetical protein
MGKTKTAQTPGSRRQRFNVEALVNGEWRFQKDCLTPGHAAGEMAFLQKQHPEVQFRVVEQTAFVPHRANYR